MGKILSEWIPATIDQNRPCPRKREVFPNSVWNMLFACDLKDNLFEFSKENSHPTIGKIKDKALKDEFKLVQSTGKKNTCYYFDCYRKGEPCESQSFGRDLKYPSRLVLFYFLVFVIFRMFFQNRICVKWRKRLLGLKWKINLVICLG